MKYYKYAGNPSCGCCDDPCPYIQISRCNFNEYCTTSGEEWREHDYGTQSRPDKQCELWYTQSATISIDSSKTGAVDGAVWIEGFGAGAWDDKYRGSSQTRADGDTFVKYHTLTLGNKTIVYSITSVWLYDSGTSTYHGNTTYRVYVDNILYWVGKRDGGEDTSTEGDLFYNWVIYRRGNNIDVYIDGGSRWVWSFTDASSNTFTYAFQAVYTGSTKYICVTPNLTWRTVKYKPDPDCVYYPPGTLTQTQIKDIETRQKLSFENNDDCRYTSGTFCPEFSPDIGIRLSSKPGEYSACPSLYRPVYVNGGRYSIYQNWDIQKTSYCKDSGIARRINLYVYQSGVVAGASVARASDICSDFPYGYTIDYCYYIVSPVTVTDLSIIINPQYGTATIYVDRDNDNNIYRYRLRYTAPSSLLTGTCIDWLEYQLTGQYGETSRGVLKFKLYPETETQSEVWEEYMSTSGNCNYWQDVLKLVVEGERVNVVEGELDYVGQDQPETQWRVELYGLIPHEAKTYTDFSNVIFRYIPGVSSWSYQCDEIGTYGDSVGSSHIPPTTDYYYPCYENAKTIFEAMTANITTRIRSRGEEFIVSNNNILESCSSQAIDSTTATIAVALKKTHVYIFYGRDGAETTETVTDTQSLPNQTFVIDWGESPAESPVGLFVPSSQVFSIDASQYYSRFEVNTVAVGVTIRVGYIGVDAGSSELWRGNYQSGTTQSGYDWRSYDYVTATISGSVSIQYF